MGLISQQSVTPKRDPHWSQIIGALAGVSAFIFSLLKDAGMWAYSVTGVLSVVLVILVAQDLHLFSALTAWRAKRSENRCARRVWKEFQSIIEKAQQPSGELYRLLHQHVTWRVTADCPMPKFVTFAFDNWLTGIRTYVSSIEKIRDARELEGIGGRFREFIEMFNEQFIGLYVEGLLSKRATYASEQGSRLTRQAKEQYDLYLRDYNLMCERIKIECGRQMLVPIFILPQPIDYS